MSLRKEWYSIKEAATKLGLPSTNDVEQFLETGQLHAAVRIVKMFSCDTVIDPDGVPDPTCPIGLPPLKCENIIKCNNGLFEIDDYIKIDLDENASFNLFNVAGRLFEIADPENIITKIYPKALTVYRNDLVITAKELDSAAVSSDKIAAPYLDQNHKHYSEELAVAVNTWRTLYDKGGTYKVKKSHKEQIKTALAGNSLSQAAINRITTLVNPNKGGGAPPTDD